MKRFRKRMYRGPLGPARDLGSIVLRARSVPDLVRGRGVDGPFRERLMLTVTAVNECRYCRWIHTRAGRMEGLDEAEMWALARGKFDDCPEDQIQALMYARHWAESDGRPDPEVRRKTEERYGKEQMRAIELVLHSIRVGNLTGNTLDGVLHGVDDLLHRR